MALTDQEKVLQAGILAEKTDTTTNPNMVYSTAGAANKGLNPAYFTGNNTKIVNAMNATYKQTLDHVKYDTTDDKLKINGAIVITQDDIATENIDFSEMF